MNKPKFQLAAPLAAALIVLAAAALACAGQAQVGREQADASATLAALHADETSDAQLALSLTVYPPPTYTPAPSATLAPSATPTLRPAEISGKLGYPADHIPPLTVVAFNLKSGEHFKVDTALNQMDFRFEGLPAGLYHLVAYPQEGIPAGFAGGYTRAVACGLSVDCTDHTLVDVPLAAGQQVEGIQITDWYAPQLGEFPPNPYGPIPGSIAGALSYPAEGIPALQVYAINASTNGFYRLQTQAGQSSYKLENVQPGTYFLVAYPSSGALSAGYTQAVLCGLSEACSVHTLIGVTVAPGQAVADADILDWYAPVGTIPPNPLP